MYSTQTALSMMQFNWECAKRQSATGRLDQFQAGMLAGHIHVWAVIAGTNGAYRTGTLMATRIIQLASRGKYDE